MTPTPPRRRSPPPVWAGTPATTARCSRCSRTAPPASSSVVGHVAGRQLAQIVAAFDAGDHAEALRIFRSIIPAIDALNGAGFQAVAAKAALQVLGVLPERSVRLPLVPASDDELALIRDGLRAAGLLDVVVGDRI